MSQSGRSVAWLARLVRVQEVVRSNRTAPTTFIYAIPEMRRSELTQFAAGVLCF
jgi:hypothetical protein